MDRAIVFPRKPRVVKGLKGIGRQGASVREPRASRPHRLASDRVRLDQGIV